MSAVEKAEGAYTDPLLDRAGRNERWCAATRCGLIELSHTGKEVTFYSWLGVGDKASNVEITKAYKKKSLELQCVVLTRPQGPYANKSVRDSVLIKTEERRLRQSGMRASRLLVQF